MYPCSGRSFFASRRTVETMWGDDIITGVCGPLCSRLTHALTSLLLQLLSSEIRTDRERRKRKRKLRFNSVEIIINHTITIQHTHTLRQFSLVGGRRFAPATAGGAPAAHATDDRHCIIISARLQRVPVGDERQPAIIPLQGHLKGHKSL